MNITILDGVVIAITLVSALLAMFRGFVREVLSIAAWVIAAVCAYLFYDDALPYVQQYIGQEIVAVALSAAGVFFVVLVVVSFITMKISDFVIDSRVGFLDRTLGFIFGAARGILLAVVALIFLNWLVSADNRPGWVTAAKSYPFLTQLGDQLLAVLPEDPEAALRERLDDRFREGLERPAARQGDPTQQPGYQPEQQQGLDQLIESTGEDETPPATDAPSGAELAPAQQ